ncbi:sugar ABC transporter ATP-binding protein [Candidatus Poriferisodalis sp.]|uniref:sugar ABC transporter ATP-binding protein n=1 Tax=Candidatus Poriferisodalis sp. TaxID=3101277 RepID=UPI003C6FA20D
MTSAGALVSVRNVSKRFGATDALKDVTVEFEAGRVHGLVGENGAGKSTLAGVVLGIHTPDSGELTLDGSPLRLDSPAEGVAQGLVGVAQELSLLPSMSVVDNVMLGTEEHVGPFVRRRANRSRVEALIVEHGLSVPVDARVGSLAVADQQKVEILRALGRRSRLVVLDEPTARLASHEARELRHTVRELAARGVAVVYVSHFLDEVLSVSDTVTVMRDGRVVRTGPADTETHESLVEGMTGRHIDDVFPAKPPAPSDDARVVLRVDGLCSAGAESAESLRSGTQSASIGGSPDVSNKHRFAQVEGRSTPSSRSIDFFDVSLSVRSGEIVGLVGLVGAGRSEAAHAFYGASPTGSGSVTIDGRPLAGTVQDALANGVRLIPESRRHQGLIAPRSVVDNTTLPNLRSFVGRFGIRKRQEEQAAIHACDKVDVRAPSLMTPVAHLSGGNQQKVLFARAVLGELTLLIADEPTRGVDVGSKRSIYETVNDLARKGCAVLLVSSELDEVIGTCHRALVMRSGRIVAEFVGDDIVEANLLAAAFGTGNDNGSGVDHGVCPGEKERP